MDDALKSRRADLTPRGGDPSSFFTLGANLYLDVRPAYDCLAQAKNEALGGHLAWLVDKLCDYGLPTSKKAGATRRVLLGFG